MKLAEAVALYSGQPTPVHITSWWCVISRPDDQLPAEVLAVYGYDLPAEAQRAASEVPRGRVYRVDMRKGHYAHTGHYLTVDGRLIDFRGDVVANQLFDGVIS